jgi:hypothetical protein
MLGLRPTPSSPFLPPLYDFFLSEIADVGEAFSDFFYSTTSLL